MKERETWIDCGKLQIFRSLKKALQEILVPKHCATAAPERKSWFSSHVLCDSKSVTSEVIIIVSPIKSSLECVTQSVSQTFAPHSGESFAKFTDWLQLLAHCRDAIMPFMLKFIPNKVCIVYINSKDVFLSNLFKKSNWNDTRLCTIFKSCFDVTFI